MNAPDESPDDLTRDYRSASASDAGAPSAATRAAILAEARAAALRRTPAANDSRIWWSAAASVAVLGVAVLLWRQSDIKPEQVAYVEPAVEAQREDARDTAAPQAAPPSPVIAAEAEAELKSEAPPRPATSRSLVLTPAPGAESSGAAADSSDSAANFAQSRNNASAKVSADPTSQLLRRQFPAEYASGAPPRALWIVEDAEGGVLRSGRLEPDEDFDAVTVRMQREFPQQDIGPWRVTPVTNARGIALQLGVARVQK